MSTHNITVQGGTSVRLPTAGKYCDRDIIVTAEGGGGGINVTLPTRTVMVVDNDYAGDIKVTVLVNEGGKLVYKSMDVPSGGALTLTYAWYTPIFITSRWAASISVEDAEGDWIRYAPYHYDATNSMFAVFPQSDGGSSHTVYVYQ